MIQINCSFNGNSVPFSIAPGTTAAQLTGNNTLRTMLGLPANTTAIVNGAHTTGPLNNGDQITFQTAPSGKA